MPQFDVDAARKAGYSDDEILAHLTQGRTFDMNAAVKAGYSKPEIIQHLAETPTGERFSLGPSVMKPDSTASWLTRKALGLLPAVGGTVGGILGSSGGPATAVGGAALGETSGEALRQLGAAAIYGTGPQTSEDAATNLLREAVIGGTSELAGQGAGKLGAKVFDSAAAHYAAALKPQGTAAKTYAQDIADEMAARHYPARTLNGLVEDSTENATRASQAVEAELQRIQGQPSSIDSFAMLQALLNRRRKALVLGTQPAVMGNEPLFNNISAQIKKLNDIRLQQGRYLSPESVVGLRRILDEQVQHASQGFTKDLADASQAEALKQTGNVIREELAAKYPDLAAANQNAHFWIGLRDLANARKLAEVGSNPVGRGDYQTLRLLLAAAGGGAGYTAGGPFGGGLGMAGSYLAAGKALQAAQSPLAQTGTANMRAVIGDLLQKGYSKEAIAAMLRMATSTATQPDIGTQ